MSTPNLLRFPGVCVTDWRALELALGSAVGVEVIVEKLIAALV
jgi:hypothetical protein